MAGLRKIDSRMLVVSALCALGLFAVPSPAAPVPADTNSVFNPLDFTSCGALVMTGAPQSVTFDTSNMSIQATGVSLVSTNGTNGISESGDVELAVFCFDYIDISSGTINVTGYRGLVLLSRDGITISGAAIALDGESIGGAGTGGDGAPGATGDSGPHPPSDDSGGDGGDGGASPTDGVGLGPGTAGSTSNRGGGGGGYGGRGANGSSNDGQGGLPYGDRACTNLYGGSGGAGGYSATIYTGGGGGGGAIELVALTQMSLGTDGVVSVKGGGAGQNGKYSGGCGSGGGVVLAARDIQLGGGTNINAQGGSYMGGNTGGAGGGGRVAFYSTNAYGSTPASVLISAGTDNTASTAAENGTFTNVAAPQFILDLPWISATTETPGPNTATLTGYLHSTGSAPTTVWAAWDTVSTRTANDAPGDWAASSNLGTKVAGPLSVDISGLSQDTRYYWTFYASNSNGRVMDAPFRSFRNTPTVSNQPPTGISVGAATLNGYVVSTGGAPATAFVYWGPTDGGAVTSGLWQFTNEFTGITVTNNMPLSTNVTTTGFAGETGSIFCRFHATNVAGHAWDYVDESQYFVSSNIWVSVTQTPAAEPADAYDPATQGKFTIYRLPTATGEAITVNYTLAGATHGAGGDYTLLPVNATGSITIAKGDTSTNLAIVPLFDTAIENESITLTLAAGHYPIHPASNSAVIPITDTIVKVAAQDSIFNPGQFSSLGTLNPASSVIFNTSNLTVTVDGGPAGTGTNGYSENGNIRMGVFAFNSIDLGSSISVTVTGHQGLALLSLGDVMISTTVSVSGASNSTGTGGAGGPGGEGGTRSSSYLSAPPGTAGGDGGNKVGGVGYTGTGYGAGLYGNQEGGGAGYGGAGGNGEGTSSGGSTYPGTNATLADLYGGSGGGGGASSGGNGGGGGGGGSLQITARGTITIAATGSLEADGGNANTSAGSYGGGAGSGGGILLAAPSIVLTGTVSAEGGNAVEVGGGGEAGGGGGGGRVAFYSDEDWGITMESPYTNAPAAVLIDGGTTDKGTSQAGSRGTFYAGETPSFLNVGGALFRFR